MWYELKFVYTGKPKISYVSLIVLFTSLQRSETKPALSPRHCLSFTVCICHILFTHSSSDEDLDYIFFLAIVNKAAMNVDIQICLSQVAFNSLGIYPEEELLDHMVVLFLIL